jgi:small nuclear ribonucleoprotein (snRNP)-like protein
MLSSTSPSSSTAIAALKALLRQLLRITVVDGRIFLGTFVGTDQSLNIILVSAEEFRIGPKENRNGRYVGQIMIPWKLVVSAEVQCRQPSDRGNSHRIDEPGYL